MHPAEIDQYEVPLLDDTDVSFGAPIESDVLISPRGYTVGDLSEKDVCCSANNESSVLSSTLDSQDNKIDAKEEEEDVVHNDDDDGDGSELNDPDQHGSLLANNNDNNNNISGGGGVSGGHFFEGAEKRLAIYFKHNGQPQEKNPALDLRRITRAQWTEILNMVHCRILNVIHNEHYHAYLLSESSLFVAENFFILKTCGSTTLLAALDMILDVVFNFAGFDSIEDVYYSHKNLLLPRLQKKPHNSFVHESQKLDKVFDGMAQVFGHINADRWYLYTKHDYDHYGYNHQKSQLRPGSTLNHNEHFKFEMIMEELDQTVMQWFFADASNLSAKQVTHQSGIDSIIPGMVIDDFLFTPCGYSMNGLLGKYYMTIHITPETEFSYVSLETNVPQKSYPKFIANVLDVFKPGKFMLNLFVPNFNYQKCIHHQRELNELIECSGGGNGGDGVVDVDTVDGDDHAKDVGVVDDDHDASDPNNNNNPNSGIGSKCSSLDSFGKIHGFMLFEAFSQQPDITIGYNHYGNNHYRRCDFQMVQNEHLDIIYARYVNEGIS